MRILFVFAHSLNMNLFINFAMKLYIRISSLLKFISNSSLGKFQMHIFLVWLDLLSELLILISNYHLTTLRRIVMVSNIEGAKSNSWIKILHLWALMWTFLEITLRSLIALNKLRVLNLYLISKVNIKAFLIKIWLRCTFWYLLLLRYRIIHICPLNARS